MAVIAPFNTTTVTRVAASTSPRSTLRSVTAKIGAPTIVGSDIFYQRIYGVTVNITDDGVENLDVLTTVSLA